MYADEFEMRGVYFRGHDLIWVKLRWDCTFWSQCSICLLLVLSRSSLSLSSSGPNPGHIYSWMSFWFFFRHDSIYLRGLSIVFFLDFFEEIYYIGMAGVMTLLMYHKKVFFEKKNSPPPPPSLWNRGLILEKSPQVAL